MLFLQAILCTILYLKKIFEELRIRDLKPYYALWFLKIEIKQITFPRKSAKNRFVETESLLTVFYTDNY